MCTYPIQIASQQFSKWIIQLFNLSEHFTSIHKTVTMYYKKTNKYDAECLNVIV
jgi:hypothetical protein